MSEVTHWKEYLYPEIYDLENPYSEEDGKFFFWLAEQYGHPILDLGCGTGRITIPLAQKGYDVTGLDLIPEMLDQARRKAEQQHITWIEADVRSFHIDKQFNLIIENGSVFMHMLTRADQNAFLERVRDHLAPGGAFATGLLFPHPEYLQTDLVEKDWYEYIDPQGRLVKVSGFDVYDELLQIKTETAIRRFHNDDGVEQKIEAPLSLRYTFPQEMETLLHCNGFQILHRFGGPDQSPLTSKSQMMIFVSSVKEV